MFQTFDVTARPEQGPPRLADLRKVMQDQGLDGFLVPRADVHQGEYVAPRDARLAWLTGFTGSAGFCAALTETAGVFIDGRYRAQIKAQVDLDHFTPVNWPETKLGDWLKEQLGTDSTVGYDPWLHTKDEVDQLLKALSGTGIVLFEVEDNLVDQIWADQPAPPLGRIEPYPFDYAGETSASKRTRLAQSLQEAGEDHAVITLPDSLCWLLNIRGSDIERNPVVQGFAVLHADGSCTFYTAPEKAEGLADHLGPDVRLCPPDTFVTDLAQLTGRIRLDPKTAPSHLFSVVEDDAGEVSEGEDPCILPKARKNAVEIAGTTEAHLRDGAAMVEFLAWLDAQPTGSLTEIDVVKKLEGFRRATNALREISFETIAGAGPNGAIVHYRVTHDTNRPVNDGELLLVDSGGQYLDGTTDITRTIAIGQPDEDHCTCFTRVLQGMIAISWLRWPTGLAGRDLDALARYPLWLAGQNYDHGTGHGVGVYLSVHEGPQRLSKVSHVPLEPGMILSNEPGYYREGAFGIRIENLVVVEEAAALPGGDAQRQMLTFRTLTFVPIDRRLVATNMLSEAERDWLNTYHKQVAEVLAPRLSEIAKDWLTGATAPI